MVGHGPDTTTAWGLPLLGIFVLFAIVLVLVLKVFQTYKRLNYYFSLPGLEKYSPFLGNVNQIPASGEGKMQFGDHLMQSIHNKFICFWMTPVSPDIMVYHPDTVKVILQASATTVPKSRGFGKAYEYGIPWVGEGVLLSNGDQWSRGRRLLNPVFHSDILKNYLLIFNEATDKLIEKFDKFAETGESFDICPLVTMCTLEIIMKCFLSRDVDIQSHKEGHHPYAKAVMEMSEIWAYRHWRPWLWPDWIFRRSPTGKTFFKHCDYVHKIGDEVVEKRKQMMEKGTQPTGKTLEFIDILLSARYDDGQPMSSVEIRNQVDTFIFAGHDTTATTISFHMYNLATHPEHQEHVQEEVDNLLDGRDTDEILWEDLAHMKTMSLCSKESMRLYTPVPFVNRTLTKDIEIDGNNIPAGTTTTVCIAYLHRNPSVWDHPDEFRPERFLNDDIDKHAYYPFSGGPRNCIGQVFGLNEEKVILGKILRRYKLGVTPDHEPPRRVLSAITKSENGVWLTLKRR